MNYYAVLEKILDQYEKLFKELESRFTGDEFKSKKKRLCGRSTAANWFYSCSIA